jgi:polar amino acid transport system permease protein
MVELLVEGLGTSVTIFFATLVGAIPLGIPLALARLSKFKPLSMLARLYISIIRGTPLMLQMFAVYFAPFYVFGISTGSGYKFTACLIAFILNYAAYFAEIYRSGIQSIPQGQYEAAEVLGYSRAQAFFHIILPQVVKRIVPAMGNEIITLVKDTSLAFSIGVAEMFTEAKALVASQRNMVPFAIAAAIYWVVTLVVTGILNRVEKKLSYYHD